MTLPTEPVGSIPRPAELTAALDVSAATDTSPEALAELMETAVRDTLAELEATGSPVLTDGEQGKYPDFITYPLNGLDNLAPDGLPVPDLAYGRCLPRLTAGPFRYGHYADRYLEQARRHTHQPIKQAIIAPALLSLVYPLDEIPGYSREAFLEDLLREHRTEIRRCLDKGAYRVQIDFAGAELAIRLDPTGELLNSFIYLNNLALDELTDGERQRTGVHLCVDCCRETAAGSASEYATLLPSLLELHAGNFYIALAREPDRRHVLQVIRDCLKPGQRIFIGVINPDNPVTETAEEVMACVLQAADYIPPGQLGTTDDCGYSPRADKTPISRRQAFEKIRARVAGTALASEALGLGSETRNEFLDT